MPYLKNFFGNIQSPVSIIQKKTSRQKRLEFIVKYSGPLPVSEMQNTAFLLKAFV